MVAGLGVGGVGWGWSCGGGGEGGEKRAVQYKVDFEACAKEKQPIPPILVTPLLLAKSVIGGLCERKAAHPPDPGHPLSLDINFI